MAGNGRPWLAPKRKVVVVVGGGDVVVGVGVVVAVGGWGCSCRSSTGGACEQPQQGEHVKDTFLVTQLNRDFNPRVLNRMFLRTPESFLHFAAIF